MVPQPRNWQPMTTISLTPKLKEARATAILAGNFPVPPISSRKLLNQWQNYVILPFSHRGTLIYYRHRALSIPRTLIGVNGTQLPTKVESKFLRYGHQSPVPVTLLYNSQVFLRWGCFLYLPGLDVGHRFHRLTVFIKYRNIKSLVTRLILIQPP